MIAPALQLQPYLEQVGGWPRAGRHILAQFDTNSIWVYQAYRPAIADYAVAHQRFGGEFSFSRTSWIKPNFLWMMYRCGWATKVDQERVLAIRLRRSFFDELLSSAVASTFNASGHASREAWQAAVAGSSVRLQWDPDHDPRGHAQERRALQLGLRGEVLRRFGTAELLGIADITPLVIEQRAHCQDGFEGLQTPREQVYDPGPPVARALRLDAIG